MKWIILFTSLFFIQTQAQNINLSLIEDNIHVKDDTLYFKFKLQNNSYNTFVFYNLNYDDIGDTTFEDSILKSKKITPRLLVDVYIKYNILPSIIRARTGPKKFSKYLDIIDKYQIIEPDKFAEYNIALDIWSINLPKGEYKFQLRYFSNNYYKKNFKEAKKTNPDLKNSVLFKGILRSNVCSLSINE